MINLLKQPIECKAALKQSIKDDMEIVMIAFNQLMGTRKNNKREHQKTNIANVSNM